MDALVYTRLCNSCYSKSCKVGRHLSSRPLPPCRDILWGLSCKFRKLLPWILYKRSRYVAFHAEDITLKAFQVPMQSEGIRWIDVSGTRLHPPIQRLLRLHFISRQNVLHRSDDSGHLHCIGVPIEYWMGGRGEQDCAGQKLHSVGR